MPSLVGKDSPFGYVERLNDQLVRTTTSLRSDGRGFCSMNEKGREEWLKLTGDSKTTTASRSVSDGSQRLDALYTFAKGTIMSASALLSNSSVNLQS
jgi:hypothetical protein